MIHDISHIKFFSCVILKICYADSFVKETRRMHNRQISVFGIFHNAAFPLKDSITGEQFYLRTTNFFI